MTKDSLKWSLFFLYRDGYIESHKMITPTTLFQTTFVKFIDKYARNAFQVLPNTENVVVKKHHLGIYGPIIILCPFILMSCNRISMTL